MSTETKSSAVKSAKELVWATDKVSQNLVTMTPEESLNFFQGDVALPIVEKGETSSGRYGQAHVKVWVQEAIEKSINADTICNYLTMFDLSVLSACVSMHLRGAKYATPGTIYATLGKNNEPEPNMRELIVKSLNKLISVIINIDAKDAYKKLNKLRNKVKNQKIEDFSDKVIRGALLPAITTTDLINGKVVDGAIMFQGISPLYLYALAKDEVVSIPKHMLEVPDSVSTYIFIELKTYISSRVQVLKRTRKYDKSFPPHIVLETAFKVCRLDIEMVHNRMMRKRVREHIIKHLDHLVNIGELTGYQLLADNPSKHWTNKVVKDIKDCTKIRILYEGVDPLP